MTSLQNKMLCIVFGIEIGRVAGQLITLLLH